MYIYQWLKENHINTFFIEMILRLLCIERILLFKKSYMEFILQQAG